MARVPVTIPAGAGARRGSPPRASRLGSLALATLACWALPVGAQVTDADVLAGTCGGCHGYRGISVGGALPSIAGLDNRFFEKVMQEFRGGERPSTIMGRLAKGYDAAQIIMLARYYASQPWTGAAVAADPAQVDEGRRLHAEACEDCHEKEGRYQDRDTPRIAGQQPEYLYLQLRALRDPRERMPQPSRMRRAVAPLTDAQLQALSAYYGSQAN